MCTLTFFLTDDGYELFFNRDEQNTRKLAIAPTFNDVNKAVYPIDPQGGGTWIAVHQSGLSLALLNYYQATNNKTKQQYISRGQLILSLLQSNDEVLTQLKTMDLGAYQAFQLGIFPSHLSNDNSAVILVKWDGHQLIECEYELPITSSSVNFHQVCDKRKQKFNHLVDNDNPNSSQFRAFHYSKESIGMYSVNMQRDDARTLSISHIIVNDKISFEYFDNVTRKNHTMTYTKQLALAATS